MHAKLSETCGVPALVKLVEEVSTAHDSPKKKELSPEDQRRRVGEFLVAWWVLGASAPLQKQICLYRRLRGYGCIGVRTHVVYTYICGTRVGDRACTEVVGGHVEREEGTEERKE